MVPCKFASILAATLQIITSNGSFRYILYFSSFNLFTHRKTQSEN